MEKPPKLKIPSEIFQFFTNPGGHSLIVRGTAGAGKTTFALQAIEELSPFQWGFYHSTRVSDASLLAQFPWLKDRGDRLLRTGSFSDEGGENSKRTGLSDLKGVKSPPMEIAKVGGLAISIGKDLGELETLYHCIENNLPEKGLVVIDSIDALADKFNIGCSKLVNTIQRDIVEGYGSNVMFVVETPGADLDYLGDGVVNFTRAEHHHRRLRELEIVKLRGCEIQQPKFIFSLDGGRVQAFAYNRNPIPQSARGPWRPLNDLDGRISSGLGDLDRTLSGGLEAGSITLIEMGQGVPTTVTSELESALVCNFVSLGRGVLWVPMRKASAENARAKIAPRVPGEDIDRLVRIPEKAEQMTSAVSCVMPVEGASAFSDFKWQNIEYSLGSSLRPMLSLMGLDTMQSMYGSDVSDQLMDFLSMVRRNSGIFVALAPTASGSTDRLADLATAHIKIERVGGTVLLYGEEPFTECYAFNFEEKEAGGDVALTRIL